MDAFIAIGVVIVGLGLIITQYSFKPYQPQAVYYSYDVIDSLYSTKIYELNDDNFNYLKMYKANGNITSLEKTLFEQILVFLYRDESGCVGCDEMARNLTFEITNSSIPSEYSFKVIMVYDDLSGDEKEVELFEREAIDSLGKVRDMGSSSLVVPSKKFVTTLVNRNDLVMGIAEVIVWQ